MPFDLRTLAPALRKFESLGEGSEGEVLAAGEMAIKLRERYGHRRDDPQDLLAEFGRRSVHRIAHAVMGSFVEVETPETGEIRMMLLPIHQASFFGPHAVSLFPKFDPEDYPVPDYVKELAYVEFGARGFELDLRGKNNVLPVARARYGIDLVFLETMSDLVAGNVVGELPKLSPEGQEQVLRDLARLRSLKRLEPLIRGAVSSPFNWNRLEDWQAQGARPEHFWRFQELSVLEQSLTEKRRELAKRHQADPNNSIVDRAYLQASWLIAFPYAQLWLPIRNHLVRPLKGILKQIGTEFQKLAG